MGAREHPANLGHIGGGGCVAFERVAATVDRDAESYTSATCLEGGLSVEIVVQLGALYTAKCSVRNSHCVDYVAQ